ncbi:MAG: lipopolysaccharide heptosyltransferase II [Chloroflexota bacterium]
MASDAYKRILVRGVNWIGDAVMTMPAIRALRREFPSAHVTLLVKPSVAPLFEKDPLLDEVLIYGPEFRGVRGRLRLASLLRRKRFDVAVLLQNAFDAALVSFLAGIPRRIGYDRDGRGFLLTTPVPFQRDDRSMHHVRYYLELLRGAGIEGGDTSPWLYLTIEERVHARDAFFHLRRPILGVNPGATFGSAKRWLPERFAEVGWRFIREMGGSVVVFGGKAETGIAQEVERIILDRLDGSLPRVVTIEPLPRELFMNLAGHTSLRGLSALIAECDLILTNDSGPMHVAYAVGTPLVALFGSTDPALTGPLGESDEVIKPSLSCSPCFERSCPEQTLRCMRDISAGEVYAAVRRLTPQRPAVFFDRDGTLCRDAHYLRGWDEFETFPEIGHLRSLRDKGFALIGLTNQSGIARGIVDRGFVEEVNSIFVKRHGFDDFLYCPHSPDEHCPCRKPESGMVASARRRHRLDLKSSFVVGDKDADMLLARAVGAKGILVRTGHQQGSQYAYAVAADLRDAVRIILEEQGTS